MSNPNDYRLEDQIGFKLRLANQKHLEVFSRLMPDVTPTQFAVLAKLNETGSISQNHLGRLVGMDAATTKGVVDRLKKKGFLVSAQSQKDLRHLTDPRGADVYHQNYCKCPPYFGPDSGQPVAARTGPPA